MTSEPTTVYVWVWLPSSPDPVVCGRLDQDHDQILFTHGASYLARADSISLYLPELPLTPGAQAPDGGRSVAGCIDDAGPDAWGQRVLRHRHQGTSDPGLLTMLVESGSDRIGALDFQTTSDTYEHRGSPVPLEDLVRASEAVESGQPLHPDLDMAILHGSSVGGARPKALLQDGARAWIAKFSSTTDTYPVVKAEAAAMHLAGRCGIEVPETELRHVSGRDVLLVERFDRPGGGRRRMMISAATILGLPDHGAWTGASYATLADVVRARFTDARATLRQLFRRIVFNVCVSNTDDHPRNHAAFWDGEHLTLTPAYDICPQPRTGGFANQAMAIGPDGDRSSRLATCRAAAATYLLSDTEAADLIDDVVSSVEARWDDAADAAALGEADRRLLRERQILNPAILEHDG